MINPLDTPGEMYTFESMNPNPSSSKTKDGPRYRVSFEVTRDVFLDMMDAQTDGAIFDTCLRRQDTPVARDKPKVHMTKLSNVAGLLCDRHAVEFGTWFAQTHKALYDACKQEFGPNWNLLGPSERCRQMILYSCSIESRADLDTDELAAKTFREDISEPFERVREYELR